MLTYFASNISLGVCATFGSSVALDAWMMMARSSLPSSLDSSLPGISRSVLTGHMEKKYQCQHCNNILRKPVQAQCGHRYCVFCFNQLTSSGPKPCEACRVEGIFEESQSMLNGKEAFPDNAARREIDGLPAKCPNEDCTWAGTMKEFEGQHEGQCDYERITCEACQQCILRSEKDRHNERECEARTLNCKYCKVSFNFKDIKAHDEICIKYPMQCKDCGKKKIPREKFPEHIKTCAKSKTACQFNKVGCQAVIDNGKQHDHEQSFIMDHLRLVLTTLTALTSLNSVQSDGVGEYQEDCGGLGLYRAPEEGAVGGAAAAIAGGKASCSNGLSGREGRRSSNGLGLYQGADEGTSVASGGLGRGGKSTVGLELKVTALENIVCVLNRELERTSLTQEAHARQHRLDQEKIDSLHNKVRQLERQLTMRDLKLSETEQTLRELQYCTFDGVFVWKIADFSHRRQDALAGRSPALFSPAFYSSKYGYKMCLRLYLNGDGTGRGTHLSLFFVVMRGKYDALLKWPFSQKVTLMLLDQNNREHIIDAFRPDTSSTSFQRPISEMNIASGCPLFCPLAKLASAKNSYVKDDTIFIKAIVDLTGL
ncbi:TNF receptor-associated factor 2 isoform X2 [Alosa sapidissima]|uniref:TNF receptor-associated factor 2 isoform X2 n=1 Tax=Alosa sapidissima TaxID=34773 RepID=UPI001C0A0C72|nr:TNF receptor-associated factor 2 isoform X2 [Alosa sapidissima]